MRKKTILLSTTIILIVLIFIAAIIINKALSKNKISGDEETYSQNGESKSNLEQNSTVKTEDKQMSEKVFELVMKSSASSNQNSDDKSTGGPTSLQCEIEGEWMFFINPYNHKELIKYDIEKKQLIVMAQSENVSKLYKFVDKIYYYDGNDVYYINERGNLILFAKDMNNIWIVGIDENAIFYHKVFQNGIGDEIYKYVVGDNNEKEVIKIEGNNGCLYSHIYCEYKLYAVTSSQIVVIDLDKCEISVLAENVVEPHILLCVDDEYLTYRSIGKIYKYNFNSGKASICIDNKNMIASAGLDGEIVYIAQEESNIIYSLQKGSGQLEKRLVISSDENKIVTVTYCCLSNGYIVILDPSCNGGIYISEK